MNNPKGYKHGDIILRQTTGTLALCLALCLTTERALSELKPEEVAIIAMADSEPSQELAKHYADARKVPESQIYLMEGEPTETLSRSKWEKEVRPAIRSWLTEGGLESKVRCFVICWDVPLKIGKREDTSSVVATRRAFLKAEREKRIGQFNQVLKSLDELARGETVEPRDAFKPDASLQQLMAALDSAIKAAQQRLLNAESEEEKKRGNASLERALTTAGGIGTLLTAAARPNQPQIPAEAADRLNIVKGQLQGLQTGLQALAALPDDVSRDRQITRLLTQTNGLAGIIRWVNEQEELLKKNETHASFDSELSLLLWPDYLLFRWVPNPLYYRYDEIPEKLFVFMVSRLAAPSIDQAKGLIDQATTVEETGMKGKVYLDARGMRYDPKQDPAGSYGQFDQSLRDLAARLQEHTTLEVILDDQAKLFQPGDCPQALIYCGWYSLARYIDAFDWSPGAVGYHLASLEAIELRKTGSDVWCNAMLEDGITVTLGPVAEPYLAAFPLPDDFYSLLLTGRYTLAETYYRTKPYGSWQMVLVGDPLYNPFRDAPLLDESQLPDHLQRKGK